MINELLKHGGGYNSCEMLHKLFVIPPNDMEFITIQLNFEFRT